MNTSVTALEFIESHPDATAPEVARAIGATERGVFCALNQHFLLGRAIKSGVRDGLPTWRFNNLPFGCANPALQMFNTLLQEVRQ